MTVNPAPRRHRILLGALVLLLILAGAALPFLPTDNSINSMLPGDSGIHRMLSFLHEARFSGQVAISFKRGETVSQTDFTAAVDQAVDALDSPYIEQILHKIDIPQAGAELAFFQRQLPALMDPSQFAAFTNRLTPDAVSAVLRRKKIDLMTPGGSLALPLIQRDPFDIEQNLLTRLQTLAASSGYTVRIQNGRLFSADGNHALVVLETSAAATDVTASRELLDSIQTALAGLPAGVTADVIGGHRHTVSNETVMKRDVRRAVLAAAIGFFLLFAICFRDIRAQFIFAVPLASVLLSIHLCYWLTGPLSLFVLGFGVVIVGIAVDYGIHVYVAARSTAEPRQARRKVLRPVVLGALTTLGVFVAFFSAGAPGYSQMAVFSIISILLSLLGALYVLPLLLNPKAAPVLRKANRPVRSSNTFFLLWLLVLTVLLIPFPRLSFESDLRALDGSEADVWQAEEHFRSVWGDGAETLALVVLDAPDLETALNKNDELFAAIRKQGDAEEFSSLSSVWKSRAHRAQNLARWTAFWTPERIQTLRATFAAQNPGFKTNAFEPFFQTLENPPQTSDAPDGNQMFDTLQTRFTQSMNGRAQIISFFPDSDEWIRRVKKALGQSDALLISRREINQLLSTETVRTVKRLASLAVALVVLFTALLMRRPGEVVLALLPAAVSVPAVLKTLETAGLPIHIPTLIAGIVVIGLAIDYGIFMVFGCRRRMLTEVCTAVTLSTLTSLIGAGVLLLTRHPALFSIGVTLVAGLTAAYATALCAVPFLFYRVTRLPRPLPEAMGHSPATGNSGKSLHDGVRGFSRYWKKRGRNSPNLGKTVCALMVLVVSGCAVFQPRVPVELTQAPQAALPAPQAFRAVQSVVFNFYGRSMTGIGVLAMDRANRSFELSCMTPLGSKLFDLRYANETPQVLFALPFLTEHEGFGEAVAADIARIYFDLHPPVVTRAWRRGDVLWIESDSGDTKLAYAYTGDEPALSKKRVIRNRALDAQIEYRGFFEQDGFRCIGEASLKSKPYGYELTVRTKELTIQPEKTAESFTAKP